MATDRRKALEKEYRKLAKRADQRLLRLEERAKAGGKYKSVKQYAYRVAQRDIRAWSGEKATRFNTKPPSNTNQLKAKIADIKKFLSSASSTIGKTEETAGIASIYEQRARTLNEKYGTNFDWQDLARFFESGLNEKLEERYKNASDTKMEAIAQIQANKSKIQRAIKKGKDVNLNLEDEVLEFEINQIVKEYGQEILKALD